MSWPARAFHIAGRRTIPRLVSTDDATDEYSLKIPRRFASFAIAMVSADALLLLLLAVVAVSFNLSESRSRMLAAGAVARTGRASKRFSHDTLVWIYNGYSTRSTVDA